MMIMVTMMTECVTVALCSSKFVTVTLLLITITVAVVIATLSETVVAIVSIIVIVIIVTVTVTVIMAAVAVTVIVTVTVRRPQEAPEGTVGRQAASASKTSSGGCLVLRSLGEAVACSARW